MLDTLLQRVAVIGAAGKMGRGVALLMLQEMARLEAAHTGDVGKGGYQLILIDTNEEALEGLRFYFKSHLQKWAEKHINALRQAFTDNSTLIDNAEVIQFYVEGALSIISTSTHLEKTRGSRLIFEAVIEDSVVKSQLFQKLSRLQDSQQAYYFTNTSSIPIHIIEKEAGLHHKVIGFHFYNPPSVQPLVELITNGASDDLKNIAREIGHRLGKMLVLSNDVAGFIGNGHFLREISYACEQVATLTPQHGQETAIAIVNAVTQDFLIRPMGIFQLADYVGLDVVQKIGTIMTRNIIGLRLHFDLIDQMVAAKITGGQRGDGSQKDGFFQYKNGAPTALYNFKKRAYELLPNTDSTIGKPPQGHFPWKVLTKAPHRQTHLYAYFHNLFADSHDGSKLAQQFLLKSREFAQHLVKSGVADSDDDVNLVLENGFAHLYGPINSYF